ncbi:phage shock envelope stress response protein PspM [Solwaraspora sp. WMMB335]|uniref:phage shock envelope stress response protein PspM n=1 Tax=Solwaraspora sp. WMMB335 TaxID=3404118 RepID=UPI003B94127B
MTDPRTRYFRTLRRLRRSARRWSVLASGFTGAAVVLVPYAGVSPVDAGWAAAAGASTALALWRWSDLRAQAALPPPPAPDPALVAEQTRLKLVATVERNPLGRAALGGIRRQQAMLALRGTAAADSWTRLDRATTTMAGLADRLTGPGEPARLEAATAEQSLRDLAYRVASVEKALRLASGDAVLASSHRVLAEQLSAGVAAYEGLVAAAASYVAEDGRAVNEHPSVSRLTEASDLLRGVAAGLAELRRHADPAGTTGTST